MATKYKASRLPLSAYNDLVNKKIKMEKVASNILGKNIRVPLTKVIKLVASQPLYLDDKELINHVKKRVYR